MGLKIAARKYMEMRLDRNLNAMHLINKLGTRIAQQLFNSNKASDKTRYVQLLNNPRGWFGMIEKLGVEVVQDLLRGNRLSKAAKRELATTIALIGARQGFSNETVIQIGGISATVTPGLEITSQIMRKHRPDLVESVEQVKAAVREGLDGKPIILPFPEDIPGAATEVPNLINIRTKLREAANQSRDVWQGIVAEAKTKWGLDLSSEITDVVVVGIGANDMYLQSLKLLINADPSRRARLHVVTSPKQMIELAKTLESKKTLVIGISRGGGTEDTLKPLEFNTQEGWFKNVIVFANKGAINKIAQREAWMIRSLTETIGGRYMREKGDIVMIPMFATASDDTVEKYLEAAEKIDLAEFPVGQSSSIIDMAGYMHLMISAFNSPFIATMSNDPILDAALRIPAQLHNEGGGKIENHSLVVGPGMPVEAFAHAGIEAFLEAAMHGYIFGLFSFNVGIPEGELALKREFAMNELHAGLTPTEMGLAFALPNAAKFTFVGGPNITLTMDGVNATNLSSLTSFYINLIWPYLMMKKCNPDSNPQVALVRKLTSTLLVAIAEGKKQGRHPYEVIRAEIPRLMAA